MTLFRSVDRLVEDNYALLVDEARGEGRTPHAIVFLVFLGVPLFGSVVTGLLFSNWHYFAGDTLLLITLFSGFGVISLVLLYSGPAGSNRHLDAEGVSQLGTSLAYVVLVGVLYLAMGFVNITFLSGPSPFYHSSELIRAFARLNLFNVALYFLAIHYLLSVVVLVGRIYRLGSPDAVAESA